MICLSKGGDHLYEGLGDLVCHLNRSFGRPQSTKIFSLRQREDPNEDIRIIRTLLE